VRRGCIGLYNREAGERQDCFETGLRGKVVASALQEFRFSGMDGWHFHMVWRLLDSQSHVLIDGCGCTFFAF